MNLTMQTLQVDLGSGVELRARHIAHPDQKDDVPPVLLLHEALGCIEMWKDFPEKLARASGLDVWVYDRLGYGGSTPINLPRDEDYLIEEGEIWLPRLINKLDIDRVVLLGHSDGGSVALVGAAHMPDRVACLITEAAHIYIDHLTRAGIQAALEAYQTTDLPQRLAKYHGERTDILFRAWHETWLRERRNPMDLSPWLPRIECAALIVQGENDQYGVPEQVTDICEGIGARAKALFLPECAHVPHFEAPERFVTEVTDFIHQHVDD